MAAAPLDQDADDAQVSDGLEAEVVVDTEVLETLEERMHGLREDLSEGGGLYDRRRKGKIGGRCGESREGADTGAGDHRKGDMK